MKKILIGILLLGQVSVFAYGPTGHEIVGGIADKLLANTPAAEKIYALTDGITLERASTMPDEIKAWDRSGVDDANAFPNYRNHPKIDNQLREFWRANPPTQDRSSANPSHHWFHYTDVPVHNVHRYSDGTTGRSEWDIVHIIRYCIEVLRGEVPEENARKITKPVAVILLVHFVADIHEPLHVGAQYFSPAGQPVDPDKGQAGLEDEGGNTLRLRLSRGTSEQMAKRDLKLHGFWDQDAVMANLPPVPAGLSRKERFQFIEPAKQKIIDRFVKEQPKNWRAPAGVALKNYGEYWADNIMPAAREAHERLQFVNMHETTYHERTVIAGDAREKNMPDGVGYADWSAKIVISELHQAGWRLADLLSQAVGSTSASAAVPSPPPSQTKAPPTSIPTPQETDVATAATTAAASPSNATSPASAAGAASPNRQSNASETPVRLGPRTSEFGVYPANYKEIVTAWMKKNSLDASRIDWQAEPKPAEMPNDTGRRVSGYLVIFNTPDRAGMKTRSVLIRDGAIVSNSGF